MNSSRGKFASIFILIVVGLLVGVLSGLFGIGGGIVIVPALVIGLGMDLRLAAGTSVAAILPTAVVGAVSYAALGNVDWVAAACLAGGIIAGAQVGSRLLSRFPIGLIQWIFMAFLVPAIVGLWFVVPQRDDEIAITLVTGILLVLTGILTGIIGGLVGVGGGIIVVPVLMFFFGASDLDAKGTSLVMMIPGSLSGTFANFGRGNVDLKAALFVGVPAAAVVPFGTILAGLIDPLTANILFSVFLVTVLLQLLIKRLRAGRAGR